MVQRIELLTTQFEENSEIKRGEKMAYIDDVLTVDQYLLYKEQGLFDKDILQKIHYSRDSTVTMMIWKKKNGLAGPSIWGKRNHLPDDFTAEKFLELKHKGLKNTEIMKEYGVTKETFYSWLKEQKESGLLPNRRLHQAEWKSI